MNRARNVAVLSLLVGGSLVACSADPSPTGSPGTSVPPGSVPTTTAESTAAATGVITSDDPRAGEIVALIEQAMPELQLQSVVFGVWVGDEELVRGAIDAPSDLPPTAIDAQVRVGQPMEAMLATVMLQLGAEGKLALDEPVAQYVPELVNADTITPRMLANSTGGTPDFVTDDDFIARQEDNPFAGWTLDELLGFAQQSPPLFEPGSNWAYSHTEMAVLVEVLEMASGQSLEDLMAERIFEPLGMDASSAHQDNAIAAPVFHAYTNGRGVYEESTFWDPTWGLNGGMNGTVADLGLWLRALNTGELLDTEDAEESLAPVTAGLGRMTDQRYFAYGSLVAEGWVIGNPSLNGYMGFTAQQRDPSVTIVVWSTAARPNDGETNASQTLSERIAPIVSDSPFQLSQQP
jgi:D-alanyl-D-alanine carboxypeptidase